jgi:hypothetical protein
MFISAVAGECRSRPPPLRLGAPFFPGFGKGGCFDFSGCWWVLGRLVRPANATGILAAP